MPYTPLKTSYAFTELMIKGLVGDGGDTLLENMRGGPIDPTIKDQLLFSYFPKRLRKMASFLLAPLSPRFHAIGESLAGCGSIKNLWKHHGAVQDYINETIAEWKRCNIDVLLCPIFGPGFNLMYCGKITPILSYTSIYNLLTFPAGVVPVTTVTREDEEQMKNYKGFNQDQADVYFKQAVSGGVGLPVSVQCVSLPWQDELCLRFMKEVDNLVQQSRKQKPCRTDRETQVELTQVLKTRNRNLHIKLP